MTIGIANPVLKNSKKHCKTELRNHFSYNFDVAKNRLLLDLFKSVKIVTQIS